MGNNVWKGQFEVYLSDNSWLDVLHRLKIHFMVGETKLRHRMAEAMLNCPLVTVVNGLKGLVTEYLCKKQTSSQLIIEPGWTGSALCLSLEGQETGRFERA